MALLYGVAANPGGNARRLAIRHFVYFLFEWPREIASPASAVISYCEIFLIHVKLGTTNA